jgi:sugar lactone lactonase YvrE
MKWKFVVVVLLLLVLSNASSTMAQGDVEWVKQYDAAHLPEGIAVDLWGNVYVSMRPGEVRKLTPDGAAETVLYQFPTGTGLAGLATDVHGNVYVGVIIFPPDPALSGVWRINRFGQAQRLPGSEMMVMPNGLTFDPRGNLYVTDTWRPGGDAPAGAIWRIPPGGQAELWYEDSVYLGGVGALPNYPPLGANGIVYDAQALYVANTEKGHVVRFPVSPDGMAGTPSIVAANEDLLVIDGLAVDVRGTLYAAIIGQNSIVRIEPDSGATEIVATAGEGLDGPASLAFGVGPEKFRVLYFTNYAVLSDDPDPGVLKLTMPWLPVTR